MSADDRYRGKPLLVTGKIKAIKKDFLGDPYLELSTNGVYESVWAHFDKDSMAALAQLSAGGRVTVLCIGNNVVIGNPQLKDCALK